MKTKPNEYLLTDKTREDFFDYLKSDPLMIISGFNKRAFMDLPYCMQLAYIVQWFDNVQIHIDLEIIPIMNSTVGFKPSIQGIKSNYFCFERRYLAVEQGIKAANDIYNKLFIIN